MTTVGCTEMTRTHKLFWNLFCVVITLTFLIVLMWSSKLFRVGFIIFELFTVFFSRIGPVGEYLP